MMGMGLRGPATFKHDYRAKGAPSGLPRSGSLPKNLSAEPCVCP